MKNLKIFLFLIFMSAFQANAAENVRLGIMPFLSRSSEISNNQAARIADIITRNLHASPSISLVERARLGVIAAEQGLSMNQDSALKIGHLAGCQYIVLGSLTQITEKYSSSLEETSLFTNTKKTMREATASIEARVIDVATGRVVLSFSKSGSAVEINNGEKKGNYTSSYSGSAKLREEAVEAAASRLSDKIREVLANEYAMIISVSKSNIRINRGKSSGVNSGALYRVYEEGAEIFDLNGASLGKRIINLALVRVKSVSDEFSSVEIIDRQAAKKTDGKKSKKTSRTSKSEPEKNISVREGDRIEAVSLSEAEKLNFSNKRANI